jgi:short-subunit dehydrogenase
VRPPIDNGVALVTGASSGIGRVLAELLAPRVKTLILVARRRDRLEELKAELARRVPALRVLVATADLADLADTERMLDEVLREEPTIDVLVNNAGIGDLGVFDRVDWQKTLRMIDLNVRSLTYLAHRLVGPMVERGRGGVLNVSSGWGLTFGPGMSVYIATKHFVTALTESMRIDLAGTGVVVTQVCPGPVATEFESNIGNFTGMKVPGFVEISAERCAKSALRAFDRGRALVVPGVLMRMMILLGTWTPRWMLRIFHAPFAKVLRKKQLALS